MLLRQQDVAKSENCSFTKSNAKDVLWLSVEISVNQTWVHYENINFHQIHYIRSTCQDKLAFVYVHWNCCSLEVKMFLAGTKETTVVNCFLPIISSAGYIIQLPKKSDRLHKISLKLITDASVFQMTVDIIVVPHPGTITLSIHEIWQSVIAMNPKLSEILMYCCPFISSVLLYSQFVILIYLMDLVNVN